MIYSLPLFISLIREFVDIFQINNVFILIILQLYYFCSHFHKWGHFHRTKTKIFKQLSINLK